MTLMNDDRDAAQGAGGGPLTSPEPRARPARPGESAGLATALAAAFYDDPVFGWFSPDEGRRRAMLPAFFEVFTEAYLRHGEPYTDDEVAGAALWARPGTDPVGADAVYAERLEAIAGVDAPRLFEAVELLEGHAPQDAHYHLQFLAVLPERQGAGIGGRLMAPVLARCDRDAVPAYLEATSERNRALYERHGFRTTGEMPLRDGPSLWAMWRDPPGRPGGRPPSAT